MWFVINLMIVPGILVCSSFLISVCILIVSKVLLISSATVIVFAQVGVFGMFAVMYGRRLFSSVFAITEEEYDPVMKCHGICLCLVLVWGIC